MLSVQNERLSLKEESLKSLTFVEVNQTHLIHNLRLLKSMTKHPFFCAMVKDWAYGHGLLEVAHPLVDEGVSALGVNCLEEALYLRRGHILKTPILLFNSLLKTPVDLLEKFHITPVIGSFYELDYLQKNLSQKKFPVHIQITSGMSRLEFSYDEKVLKKIKDFFEKPSSKLHLEGLLTHSSYAEDLNTKDEKTIKQLESFLDLKSFFKKDLHMHALRTASLLGLHSLKSKKLLNSLGSRIGGGLYGLGNGDFFKNPLLKKVINNIPLKPTLTLKSCVVLFHEIPKGETLSYNHSFKTQRDSLIGVVPFGYAQGFLRPFCQENSFEALFKGKRVPLIGQVNMDFCFFDFTDCKKKDCKIGEEITLLGEDLGVNEVAKKLHTIPYDILVQISKDLKRKTYF